MYPEQCIDMAQKPAKSPKFVAKEIGRKYVERPGFPEKEVRVSRTYELVADIVTDLFAQIPVPVQFQKADPYDDYEDMANTVATEQKLRVYNQHTEHPYFSHMEQLAFRAVHDWFGHLEADVDFTPEGEYRKWEHMNQYFWSDYQKRLLFAEVVGQVGAVHFLPNGFADSQYDQRAFLAPESWIADMHIAVHG
jgi:hypothetical protein